MNNLEWWIAFKALRSHFITDKNKNQIDKNKNEKNNGNADETLSSIYDIPGNTLFFGALRMHHIVTTRGNIKIIKIILTKKKKKVEQRSNIQSAPSVDVNEPAANGRAFYVRTLASIIRSTRGCRHVAYGREGDRSVFGDRAPLLRSVGGGGGSLLPRGTETMFLFFFHFFSSLS